MCNKIKSFFQILRQRGILILLKSSLNLVLLIIYRDILKKDKMIKKVNEYKMTLMTKDNGISRSLILFGTRELDKKFILESIFKFSVNDRSTELISDLKLKYCFNSNRPLSVLMSLDNFAYLSASLACFSMVFNCISS